jgi:pyruvate dehydrogenase E2 component (dihydrolipoamide acetyltransferase)
MADVTLPQLGETVTEGTITQWFKKVGDTIAADEPLFEVSTDKVDTEVPSPIAGVVVELRIDEGDTVDVGTIVAVISDGAAAQVVPTPEPEVPEQAPAEPQATEPVEPPPMAVTPAPVSAQPAVAPSTSGDNRLLSPVVRRLVNEHQINPDDIVGSGPAGRITRDDVLDYIDSAALDPNAQPAVAPSAAPVTDEAASPVVDAPALAVTTANPATTPVSAAPVAAPVSAGRTAASERDTVVPLSKIRKLTGDHMVRSKATSPHAFSVVEVDFANVDATRSTVKAEFKATEGFSLTYLPFIARAIIDGLSEYPHLNASVGDDELIVHHFVDLGIAVDLAYEGLLAPVIRSAETKRLKAIAREISDLADRARTRKLTPDEISGGTFTISNNGSAGSVLTMPIINQPQVGIISTDAIVRRPVAVRTADGAEAIAIHPVGNLAMAWDHRAFDGAYAAGFLKMVKEILETRNWSAEL